MIKKKQISFDEFKEKVLKDQATKEAYDILEPEFALLRQFIKARKKAHCSQAELANRLKLQQPTIARLEKGGYTTTTVGKLAKVADALGYSLKVSLSPKKTASSKVTKKVKSKKA